MCFHKIIPVILILCCNANATKVTGIVLDDTGKPVVGAKVFLEPALESPVFFSETNLAGSFEFVDVQNGDAGIFVLSSDGGIAGKTLQIPYGDEIVETSLILSCSTVLRGTVVDKSNKIIAGALVERVAVLGNEKYSIPFSKLTRFGIVVPTSDSNGKFIINNIPANTGVLVRVSHPRYAPTVYECLAESEDVRVTLEDGILVKAKVVTRDTNQPVANINVFLRNSTPPYETSLERTNFQGEVLFRVKPGTYLCRAGGESLSSAGWFPIVVSSEGQSQDFILYVRKTRYITGNIQDATTKQPISNARVVLRADERVVDVTKTGKAGKYWFETTEGEFVVELAEVPGYQKPKNSMVRVIVPTQEDVTLPTFWVVQNPQLRLTFYEESKSLLGEVGVILLYPYQVGVQKSSPIGELLLDYAVLPAGGIIAGVAEMPKNASGAFFSLDTQKQISANLILEPWVTVVGMVKDKTGRPISGAVVCAVTDVNRIGEVVLWRTLSRGNGQFVWNWMPRNVSFRCVITDGEDIEIRTSEFKSTGGNMVDMGEITLVGAKSLPPSFYGETFPFDKYLNETMRGKIPVYSSTKPILLMFLSSEENEIIQQIFSKIKEDWNLSCVHPVFISDSSLKVMSKNPSRATLNRPNLATTFLIDNSGKVLLETFGLPPLTLLHKICEKE